MEEVVVAIALPGLLAGLVSWWIPARAAKAVTVLAGVSSFVLSLALVSPVARQGYIAAGGLFRVDSLGLVFLIASTFVYALTAVFSAGYLSSPAGEGGGAFKGGGAGSRYGPRFLAGLNLFGWAMIVATMVNNLAILWIAIEVTTIVSALLVSMDDTDGSAEAAWKYVLIASLGLGIALFATILLYDAGTGVFGPVYSLTFMKLLSGAHRFAPETVRLAYVLAVLGFGTKMGLFPVHTWLPDAHSEAPTPVSAMLSGALLAVSFYAILRYFQIAERTLGAGFPREVLLGFGVASLAFAALSVLAQRDLKRLLAYSSIEHMGILAIGASFAAPVAIVGVLLQVLAHAAAKSTAFFGAGSIWKRLGTKELGQLRGVVGALPWTGPMLVLAILGLSGLPPFGIFRSEFLIVDGGLSSGGDWPAAILVVLVVVAFLGLTWSSTKAMLTPAPEGTPVVRAEPSGLMAASMLVALVVLAVLGVHVPGDLSHLLARAAAELRAP